jgi:predicted component of type VI protein secretion system
MLQNLILDRITTNNSKIRVALRIDSGYTDWTPEKWIPQLRSINRIMQIR